MKEGDTAPVEPPSSEALLSSSFHSSINIPTICFDYIVLHYIYMPISARPEVDFAGGSVSMEDGDAAHGEPPITTPSRYIPRTPLSSSLRSTGMLPFAR